MELSNHSLVFTTYQTKLHILKQLSESSLFLDVTFSDYLSVYGSLSQRYYFFLKEEFGYQYDIAKEIKRYLPFIDSEQSYNSKRLNELQEMVNALIKAGIYQKWDLMRLQKRTCYNVNAMPVPAFINSSPTPLLLDRLEIEPVYLYQCSDDFEQAKAVYESVVSLLEADTNIEDIVILNASSNDEFLLSKLFHDSNITYISHHKTPLVDYPEVIRLVEILKQKGFKEGLDYINERQPSKVTEAIGHLLNRYLTKDMTKHPDLLISLLEDTSISPEQRTDSLRFESFESFVYDEQKHYLLMNYNDQDVLHQQTKHAFLTTDEIEEIGYYSLTDINRFLANEVISKLSSIRHLTLFFSAYTDHELALPSFDLRRAVNHIDYHYQVKDTSYLRRLNELEYAKATYNLNTYYLSRQDYGLLYNTYHEQSHLYPHSFTGIYQEDLKKLLNDHNTLTAAKIESYHLCQFQYLLKYLLKLEDYETSTNQFLGSLTHKVLEEMVTNPRFDYQQIIMNYYDFPETEDYKETVFRKALLEEMNEVLDLFIDFHKQTKFNLIETEIKFKLPYQDFYITGIIDKAMVFQNPGGSDFVVLIDYKLSSNDFKLDEFQAGRRLQLPFYLYAYLTMHEDVKPAGLYYQTTGIGRYRKKDDALASVIQLQGVSVNLDSVMKAFDEDLSHIKSLALKKDGSFKSSNRLLELSDFYQIKGQVEQYIKEMITNVTQGSFAINPIRSYGKRKDSISCEYCPFEAICYNKNKGLGGDDS